jgi:hypothetical protein
MSLRLSALLLVGLVACDPAQPDAPVPARAVEIEAPAGEGSGEPNLSSSGDVVFLSWLEVSADGGHDLWMATLGGAGWSERVRVTRATDLFVNWADFPSVNVSADGTLWAHWLQNRPGTGLAYDVRVAHSRDGGATWSDAWTPHEDGTATEHGFVTTFPVDRGMGMVWLDGRKYAPDDAGGEPAREMTLRHRTVLVDGTSGAETLLDGRTCDCCQTDAALTSRGVVVVYRDRSAQDVRDIYVTRRTDSGWTEGIPVHRDGWVISGCPVNGPAVDASGDEVAVAWFTGAGDRPQVYVAFSRDAGASFGAPVRVDGGNPSGRVDVRLLPGGNAAVSWLERGDEEGAELRLASFGPNGRAGVPVVVAASSAARASGFPRMVLAPWNGTEVVMAWTDVSDPDRPRVRVARVEVPSL